MRRVCEPSILRPYAAEAITVPEAARIAGRAARTIREWAAGLDIGQVICGQWRISIVALTMLLDGKRDALARYLSGDRHSPEIVAYFDRCGVPVPRRSRA